MQNLCCQLYLLQCKTSTGNEDKTESLKALISTDVGFLNKALTIIVEARALALLLELPEDDKTHGTYPVTFLSKALLSEVSPN